MEQDTRNDNDSASTPHGGVPDRINVADLTPAAEQVENPTPADTPLRTATPVDPAPARHRMPARSLLRTAARGTRAGVAGTGRGVVVTGRAVGRWAGRPSGRFAVPFLVLGLVLVGAGTAGIYLPKTAPTPQPSTTAAAAAGDPASQPPPGVDPTLNPGLNPSYDPGTTTNDGTTTATDARPQDTLTAWATKQSPVVGIPVIALKAYGFAQLSEQQTAPSCHLTWTTLAGIGLVESDHGREGGATLQPDGRSYPPIVGLALDGTGGRARIPDTDHGTYDGDTVYDRAIGPMQFIPSTWVRYQVDADQDGTADPNDINDAAMAAANYLCAGGRDLSQASDWWAAILSYNAIQSYARNVFTAANDYGVKSRSVT